MEKLLRTCEVNTEDDYISCGSEWHKSKGQFEEEGEYKKIRKVRAGNKWSCCEKLMRVFSGSWASQKAPES